MNPMNDSTDETTRGKENTLKASEHIRGSSSRATSRQKTNTEQTLSSTGAVNMSSGAATTQPAHQEHLETIILNNIIPVTQLDREANLKKISRTSANSSKESQTINDASTDAESSEQPDLVENHQPLKPSIRHSGSTTHQAHDPSGLCSIALKPTPTVLSPPDCTNGPENRGRLGEHFNSGAHDSDKTIPSSNFSQAPVFQAPNLPLQLVHVQDDLDHLPHQLSLQSTPGAGPGEPRSAASARTRHTGAWTPYPPTQPRQQLPVQQGQAPRLTNSGPNLGPPGYDPTKYETASKGLDRLIREARAAPCAPLPHVCKPLPNGRHPLPTGKMLLTEPEPVDGKEGGKDGGEDGENREEEVMKDEEQGNVEYDREIK